MPSKERQELIKTVAQKMQANLSGGRVEWDRLHGQVKKDFLDMAEVAVDAIRVALQEPNANQEQAGMECIINGTRHSCPEIYVVPETPWHTWRAMLNASALGEQSE